MSKEVCVGFVCCGGPTPVILIMGGDTGLCDFDICLFYSPCPGAHPRCLRNQCRDSRPGIQGGIFVDSLTIKDFEVFDNNETQDIQAVYLIKGTSIKREEIAPREEAKKAAQPQVSRQFALFFEMSDYLPEIDKTLDYFFDKVVLPGDSLIVLTPMKNYHLRSEALAQMPKEKVKEQLRGILRRDILMGGSEYRNTLADMRRILATPAG